jgi:LysM repeat protein
VKDIASKYGVSISAINDANNITPRTRLRAGTSLRIPLGTQGTDTTTEVTLASESDDAPAIVRPHAPLAMSGSAADAEAMASTAHGNEPVAETGSRARRNETSAKSETRNRKSDVASNETASKSSRNKRSVTTTSTRFETHKVHKGESLTSIADRYGVSVDDLRAWNSKETRGNNLHSGTSLKIYSEAPSKGDARKSSRATKTAAKTYKVRKGDSMSEIANKFGVSLKELKKNNPKLTDKSLKAGATVRISK